MLNIAGAAVLGVLAWVERQYGFLLLEGVWAVVSVWGLVQATSGVWPRDPLTKTTEEEARR